MKKSFCLVLLALFPIWAAAAPVQYTFQMGPSDILSDGGTGSFFWDSNTATISQLRWDFGSGRTGGVDDSLANWSQPFVGTTVGVFTFDILTGLGGVGCGETSSCVSGFYSFNGLFGFPDPAPGGNIGFEAQNIGVHDYQVRLNSDDDVHYGSFSVATIAPVTVAEPGILPLMGTGLAFLLVRSRRRGPRLGKPAG